MANNPLIVGFWRRPLLLLTFFLSGLLCLVHEVAWTRMVYPVFGMSVVAISVVVATFMAGLGLGAYLFGPRIDRFARPFRLYGVLEIGIGLGALCVPSLIGLLSQVYPAFSPLGTPFAVAHLVRLLGVVGLMLPPCLLMGATFPAFNRGYLCSAPSMAGDLALLYAFNTLGGAAGCMLSGILLPSVSTSFLVYTAACGNILIGVALFAWAPQFAGGAPAISLPRTTATHPATQRSRHAGWLLAILFLTGFLSLSFEILWTRTLLQIVRASYLSFSMILAAMLVGITVGSAIYRTFFSHSDHPRLLVAFLVLLFVASAGSFLAVFGLADLMGTVRSWIPIDDPSLNLTVARFLLCFLAFLPSAVIFGATFPFLVQAYADFAGGLAADLGRAYGANTAGSVTGILLTGLVSIEWLGSGNTLVLLLSVNLLVIALSLRLLSEERVPPRAQTLRHAPLLCAFALLILLFPRDLFFTQQAAMVTRGLRGAGEVLFQGEDATSMATVVAMPDVPFRYATPTGQKDAVGREIFHSNGIGVGGTHIYAWNVTSAYLGTLLHPNPENILIIGYGSGRQLASLVRLQQPARIDVVEISRVNIDASDHFYLDSSASLRDPRVSLYIDDGRNHLLRTRQSYDVIMVDVGGLEGDGREFFYTREFLELCAERLRPGGFLFTWLHYYKLLGEVGWMYQNTFQSVFPESAVWLGTRNRNAFAWPWIMGVKGSLEVDYPTLRARWASLGRLQRNELALAEISSPEELLSLYSGSLGTQIPDRLTSARILTDDRPPLERLWTKVPRSLDGLIDPRFLSDPSIYLASFGRLIAERASPPLRGLGALERARLEESRRELVTLARRELGKKVRIALDRALQEGVISVEMLKRYVQDASRDPGRIEPASGGDLVRTQAELLLNQASPRGRPSVPE